MNLRIAINLLKFFSAPRAAALHNPAEVELKAALHRAKAFSSLAVLAGRNRPRPASRHGLALILSA
ncbi:MAG: hypothetical protein KDI71_05820 [Xanthomonadales bacterium]|nr:hypothetical protein [Xanthomonadales bacterium]